MNSALQRTTRTTHKPKAQPKQPKQPKPKKAQPKKAQPQKKKARAYDSTLRKAQHDATRAQIVEAAYELLQNVRPEDLSYAVVAARAVVTQRTVYRHFPERSELVQAVAHRHLRVFLGDSLRPAVDLPSFAAQLARFHEMLSANPGAYRVMMAAPTRGEANVHTFLEVMLRGVLTRAPPTQRAMIMGVQELLFSPYFWEVLHTHHGVPAAQITRAAMVMATLLHDALERDPALFDIARAMPSRFRAPSTPGDP